MNKEKIWEGKTKEELEEFFYKHSWHNEYGKLQDGFNLEIIATTTCNLKCRGCDHFASIGDDWYYGAEELDKHLFKLKSEFPMIKRIHLIGGESTIHPNLLGICEVIRKYFPDNQFLIFTNGIRLSNYSNEDLVFFKEKDIDFIITKYYSTKINYAKLDETLEYNNIKHSYTKDRFVFGSHLINPEGNEDKNQFYACSKARFPIISLRDGKIYKCPFAACSIEINNTSNSFKLEETQNDFIYVDDISIEKLNNFIITPNDICAYCKENNYNFIWRPYNYDETSFFYSLRDYFLYDYNTYDYLINNQEYSDTINKNNAWDTLDFDYFKISTNQKIIRYKTGKFDIITPIYHASNENLYRYIDTLKKQTIIDDCTIYIVIDGDENEEELYDFFNSFSDSMNIVILKNEINKGPGAARNNALERCAGEYIFFLDIDDYLKDENTLEKLYNFAKSNNYDSIIYGVRTEPQYKNKKILTGNFFKRDFIKKNNIYFPELYFGEDRIFNEFTRWFNPKIGNFEEEVYIYDLDSNRLNAIRKDSSTYQILITRVINSYLCFLLLNERNDFKKNQNFYTRYFLEMIEVLKQIEKDKKLSQKELELLFGVILCLCGDYYEKNKKNASFSHLKDRDIFTKIFIESIIDNNYIFSIGDIKSYSLKDLKNKISFLLKKEDNYILEKSFKMLEGKCF